MPLRTNCQKCPFVFSGKCDCRLERYLAADGRQKVTESAHRSAERLEIKRRHFSAAVSVLIGLLADYTNNWPPGGHTRVKFE